MKLDPRNPSPVITAALLAFALSGCGQEPPPKPVVKAVPVPAAPANQDAAKAEAAKQAATRAAADKELAGRVKAALGAERNLNAHGIDVVATDGAVTLYGTAETRVRRDLAEKIAARVDGVKSVENKLAIIAGS